MSILGRLRRRRRDDEGAVLVEAAFIMPVILLIVFGILEFGLAFKNSLTVTSSTRSGARVAAAMPRTTNYQQNTAAAVRGSMLNALTSGEVEYLSIYKADPVTGEPSDGSDFETCTECYRYSWDPTASAGVGNWAYEGGTWPPLSQSACGDDGHTDYVGVYVRSRHTYLTGFFGNGLDLTAHTVMRLEPVSTSGGQTCEP